MHTDSGNQGILALLPPVWHHLTPKAPVGSGELFQTSLMAALLGGVYEGKMTYGELHQHGDFGLGTFNDLDGEMIGFGGNFYQLHADGSASVVRDEQTTPFAAVTFFQPAEERQIEQPTTKDALLKTVEGVTDENLFAAVKIHGTFSRISTRTVQRQQRPYPPLTEATAHQSENQFENVEGTLAGFRTPSFAQGIGVAGFHLHFLREDTQAGGHCLDFVLKSGTVQVQILRSFHVELPDSQAFLSASLSGASLDAQIKASEG
jgi:acetolactate decarboxylase